MAFDSLISFNVLKAVLSEKIELIFIFRSSAFLKSSGLPEIEASHEAIPASLNKGTTLASYCLIKSASFCSMLFEFLQPLLNTIAKSNNTTKLKYFFMLNICFLLINEVQK